MTPGPYARRGPRALLVGAAGVGGLLAGLLLPGPGTAAPGQETRSTLGYLCRLPSGDRQITVGVSASFPATGTVGEPFGPGEVTVEVTLPPETAAALLPEGTGAVSGAATLTAEVTQHGGSAEARWTDLDAPAARVTGGADVVLGHSGPVPAVTVDRPGDVTFTAGDLALRLHPLPGTAADGSAADGSAAPRPLPGQDEVNVACSPRDGAPAELATVPVSGPGGPAGDGAATSPPGSGTPSRGAAAGTGGTAGAPGADDGIRVAPGTGAGTGGGTGAGNGTAAAQEVRCPRKPIEAELDEDRLPKPPPGAVVSEGLATPGCVVAAGYAGVRKLGGSMLVNDPARQPGPMQLRIIERMVTAPGYFEQDSVGVLRLPDAESTFLTFGFQPTTAMVEFQTEPVTVVTVSEGGRNTTTIGYHQRLRLYDVTLNGTPLDVGPDCRTGRADTVLEGEYDILGGGLLEGEITIPPFSGCGSNGEDLDPLLNASIAGAKNPIRMQQGAVCFESPDCAAPVPELPPL